MRTNGSGVTNQQINPGHIGIHGQSARQNNVSKSTSSSHSPQTCCGYSQSHQTQLLESVAAAKNTNIITNIMDQSDCAVRTNDAVPEEIRQKGYQFCREFLGGVWCQIDPSAIDIRPVCGGLSNLLYLCSLPDDVSPRNGEPRRALLRIYGQLLQECMDTVVVDSVIFALLSEKRLGPKLYGVFPGGRVEEYIPSRSLTTKELQDPDISGYIARIMRNFHSLDMPLSKEPRWIFDLTDKWIKECREFTPENRAKNLQQTSSNRVQRPTTEQYVKLMSYNYEEEFEWLRQTLLLVKSPVVFCHNDFQEGNILYLPGTDGNSDFELMPIDFEYCGYNYRGFDIGNHFCEWAIDYKVDVPPFYEFDADGYPSKDQQVHFVKEYLKANRGSNCADPGDEEIENILVEANTFGLASHFMWVLWSLIQYNISSIEFDYLEYAEVRLDCYYQLKNNLPILRNQEGAYGKNGGETDD
ncbi:choline/ethanolamine kinase-like isoform X2 [Tubulanus polymorphus]|uniref:choline/ethanolamine kinase-like isoform X2 n=1 Tax=Tubulanus polymorphus TaxID=672921 RepID=UPI003DA5D0C7